MRPGQPTQVVHGVVPDSTGNSPSEPLLGRSRVSPEPQTQGFHRVGYRNDMLTKQRATRGVCSGAFDPEFFSCGVTMTKCVENFRLQQITQKNKGLTNKSLPVIFGDVNSFRQFLSKVDKSKNYSRVDLSNYTTVQGKIDRKSRMFDQLVMLYKLNNLVSNPGDKFNTFRKILGNSTIELGGNSIRINLNDQILQSSQQEIFKDAMQYLTDYAQKKKVHLEFRLA